MRTLSGPRLVALVCTAQVLVQIGANFWPALLPPMIELWGLTNSEAGWITGVFYLAYMLAVPVLVTLTDRIDYLAPLSNNLCYCLAVEKLLQLEIPPMAQWMRVMLTELTRLNAELVRAKADAEEANISKTRFLAAASHDILQPLNAARLYVTSLVERQGHG